MKRPLHRRAAALLWALAFVLVTVGEGFGLHPCPHHGAAAADVVGGADVHAADHGGGHAASPAHSHAPSGGAHTTAPATEHDPGQSHSGPCTCGSACQAGAGAAIPPATQAAPAAPENTASQAAWFQAATPVRLRPPHFLPFAQAPPHQG
jgi:hypothetical protein